MHALAIDGALIDFAGVEGKVIAKGEIASGRIGITPSGGWNDGSGGCGISAGKVGTGEIDIPVGGASFELAEAAAA